MLKKLALVAALVAAFTLSSKANAAIGDVPVITYMVNGVDGMTTIVNANQGDTLNIVWSATNVAYCEKWGVWGAGERLNGLSGIDTVIAPVPDTAVTGFNYQIDCYDANGVHIAQGGAQVNVTATPVVNPNPTSAPSAKVKGDGIVNQVGANYMVVGKMTVKYGSSTKTKFASTPVKVGMTAKWEGMTNPDGSVMASRLEVQ